MDVTTLAGGVMVEAPNCPTFLAEAKLRTPRHRASRIRWG